MATPTDAAPASAEAQAAVGPTQPAPRRDRALLQPHAGRNYRSKYEGSAKDYEFSRRTMEEHWLAGCRDTVHSLGHRETFEPPDRREGVRTFDLSSTPQSRASVPTNEERDHERA